jgi:hypothetical protein
MLQALIEITFSIGIPMSYASFLLVMCIQDYATTINCEIAEESETVSDVSVILFVYVFLFLENSHPQLLSSPRNLQGDFTEGNLDVQNSLQFWKPIE